MCIQSALSSPYRCAVPEAVLSYRARELIGAITRNPRRHGRPKGLGCRAGVDGCSCGCWGEGDLALLTGCPRFVLIVVSRGRWRHPPLSCPEGFRGARNDSLCRLDRGPAAIVQGGWVLGGGWRCRRLRVSVDLALTVDLLALSGRQSRVGPSGLPRY